MKLKAIKTEWFQDYKVPSVMLAFPTCSFKCEKDCGKKLCQNSHLAQSPDIEKSVADILRGYLANPITKAIVCAGLEPMDSFEDIVGLVSAMRNDYHCNDTVVIYTGYNKEEIQYEIDLLKQYSNIIVKFGRFLVNDRSRYDEVLGVTLASSNQYAEVISRAKIY